MAALHSAHNPQQQDQLQQQGEEGQQRQEQEQDDQQWQQQQHYGPKMSCASLLRYLPLPGEVQNPFLAKASTDILQSLKSKPCILSASGVLRCPHQLLLPEPHLTRPNGQQLIPNEWLRKGLPGVEYVHPDALTTAGGDGHTQRAMDVLLQLGTRGFDSKVLVAWLRAEGTRELLGGLKEEVRVSWLQDLYSCLRVLKDQPSCSSSVSMQDGKKWGLELAAAPIIQLHGSEQLVSYTEAQGGWSKGGMVFLWDGRFGREKELSLFSSSNGSGSRLLFVDPSTLGGSGRTVLSHFFGLKEVGLQQLVAAIVESQKDGVLSQQQRLQQLLFLFRNRSLLGTQQLAELRYKLQLLCVAAAPRAPGGGGEGSVATYCTAGSVFMPLAPSGAVPAELQGDLLAAGVNFLHPQYQQLWGRAADPPRPELKLWFSTALGIRELPVLEAARKLLGLYQSPKGGFWSSEGFSGCSTVSFNQHLRHLVFLVQKQMQIAACLQTQQLLRSVLPLYGEKQVVEKTAPAFKPAELWWPVTPWVGEGLKEQLRRCGVVFLNPEVVDRCCKAPGLDAAGALGLDAAGVKAFIVQVASVQEFGANKVSGAVVKLRAVYLHCAEQAA